MSQRDREIRRSQSKFFATSWESLEDRQLLSTASATYEIALVAKEIAESQAMQAARREAHAHGRPADSFPAVDDQLHSSDTQLHHYNRVFRGRCRVFQHVDPPARDRDDRGDRRTANRQLAHEQRDAAPPIPERRHSQPHGNGRSAHGDRQFLDRVHVRQESRFRSGRRRRVRDADHSVAETEWAATHVVSTAQVNSLQQAVNSFTASYISSTNPTSTPPPLGLPFKPRECILRARQHIDSQHTEQRFTRPAVPGQPAHGGRTQPLA